MFQENIHHSSFVMFGLLLAFAVIHSGGAALRLRAEFLLGARLWRLIFALASIPMASILILYFLSHRYDGVRLWNLQGIPKYHQDCYRLPWRVIGKHCIHHRHTFQ